jgi:hypothetical protein
MDIQKFSFLLSDGKLPALLLASDNLMMDIKNVCGSIVCHSSCIACYLDKISVPVHRIEINDAVESINKLTETYKVLAEQRRSLLERIKYLQSLQIHELAA